MTGDRGRASRPGGRTARNRDAVVSAVLVLLEEVPEGGLTLPMVAERAGVHVSTLYRRWGDVPSLVLDALVSTAQADVPVPDEGDLASDLGVLARQVAGFHSSASGSALLRLATRRDVDGVSGVRDAFWSRRLAAFSVVVERARARGEIDGSVPPVVVLELVTAPIHQRVLLSDLPVDDAFLASVVSVVVAGVEASRERS